jgi:hypothetical protein
MKIFYTLLFAFLLAFSTSNVLAQIVPCTLYGASNYIDFTSSPTIMMNVSVNGNSQYSYAWNDGTPVGSSNQKPFYSGFCVTITDLITGCDTTICESCIPIPPVGTCNLIYMPVCGCDGNVYSNECIAMTNGIFSYTSAIGPNGQTLPCAVPLPSWDCVNGACINPMTGLGAYTSLGACNIACIAVTPSWDCIAGQGCIDPGTGLGAFSNYLLCDSACTMVNPSWDCIAGQGCIDPGNGQGAFNSLVACNSVCATTPSWDCDGMGTCSDPGTGAGMYASQASCDNACIVNGVEEQTTNKKLLKITDLLGRETKGFKNELLFYIYDDGTVEKRIVIE